MNLFKNNIKLSHINILSIMNINKDEQEKLINKFYILISDAEKIILLKLAFGNAYIDYV